MDPAQDGVRASDPERSPQVARLKSVIEHSTSNLESLDIKIASYF